MKLEKKYVQKQHLIEEAESLTRKALISSKREGAIAYTLYFNLKKIEAAIDKATEHAKTHDLLDGKPNLQRRCSQKIRASLKGMRSIHREAQELAETLHGMKKKNIENTRALKRDIKKIGKKT